MRKSEEITAEYNELCAQLGHNFLQFEIMKSQAIAKFQELNKEMLVVAKEEAKVEAEAKAKLEAEQQKLIQLVEDVPRSKLDEMVNLGKKLKGVK